MPDLNVDSSARANKYLSSVSGEGDLVPAGYKQSGIGREDGKRQVHAHKNTPARRYGLAGRATATPLACYDFGRS